MAEPEGFKVGQYLRDRDTMKELYLLLGNGYVDFHSGGNPDSTEPWFFEYGGLPIRWHFPPEDYYEVFLHEALF